MADKMSIDNNPNGLAAGTAGKAHHVPHPRAESEESASTPDQERSNTLPQAGGAAAAQEQAPKRKGGRKPIYATSEERKQRNRQAQAAFRERRTEYIKQLEETIRVHESNLHNLQGAHRTAADECLMLRYKNSLLERILLEKGIDVQAELRAKTGSPSLGPTHMAPNMVQPPPIQRAIMNRHHQSRKSTSSVAPKSDTNGHQPVVPHSSHASSPKNNRPTPSSHSDSPTNTASGFSPAPSDNISVRGSMASGPRPSLPHQMSNNARQQMLAQSKSRANSSAPNNGASYYPTPSFQNHMEQLEQEYDAPPEIMDDSEMETPGPGPYPSGYNEATPHVFPSPTSTGPGHHPPAPPQDTQPPAGGSGAQYPSMTQLLDGQNLDWDPFGLSASMAFPTQHYGFDQSTMR